MDARAEIAELASRLRAVDLPSSDCERVDMLAELETLRAAVAATQARLTVAFADSQCADQAAAGVPSHRVGRGVAAQVGLARRISPFAAARYLGFARIVVGDLPQTFAELEAGRISEWRAMLVTRETGWLSRIHRGEVDRQVASRLGQLGDRRAVAEARRVAQRLDQAGAVARVRQAETERRVSIRPAPDTMCQLSTLLPVAQGVAAYAALSRYADTHVGVGDEARGRGQLMADMLVERLTGQANAPDVAVEVQLVMPHAALFGEAAVPGDGFDEPAWLAGYGPVPAALARALIHQRSARTPTWLRRLYQHPHNGGLVAMESRRRTFTAAQRRFVATRDQFCRTPWCEAPIRHADHVRSYERGGPTAIRNAQGLCEACNHAKQAVGWRSRTDGDDIVLRTPTGHRYRSRAPVLFPPPFPIEYTRGQAA